MKHARRVLVAAAMLAACQEVEGADESSYEPSDLALQEVASAQGAANAVRQPEYDEHGRLKRPEDAEDWVFMGTGVNLNYSETPARANAPDVMTVAFMEPSAYREFERTGRFPEGTMTALVGYLAGSGEPPAKAGKYLGERVLFEMSVKDSRRNPADVWTYYGFRGDAQVADPHPAERCQKCHVDNAETDLVFTQFYPRMRRAR